MERKSDQRKLALLLGAMAAVVALLALTLGGSQAAAQVTPTVTVGTPEVTLTVPVTGTSTVTTTETPVVTETVTVTPVVTGTVTETPAVTGTVDFTATPAVTGTVTETPVVTGTVDVSPTVATTAEASPTLEATATTEALPTDTPLAEATATPTGGEELPQTGADDTGLLTILLLMAIALVVVGLAASLGRRRSTYR
jgi:hypothetical protein